MPRPSAQSNPGVMLQYSYYPVSCHTVFIFYHFRYTHNSTSKAVYGILLKWPNIQIVILESVKMSSSSKVSLLGYGPLSWEAVGNKVAIELPSLPLDSDLQWAWTLKFEDISPAVFQ